MIDPSAVSSSDGNYLEIRFGGGKEASSISAVDTFGLWRAQYTREHLKLKI
jgi:hypothetical protein